ncbi:MAG: oligopeptide transporter, OPT family [Bacteroidetes bacterium]|jgi:putative OPT family oligopeptide transporter|nr:oligopeptide transporter, OPT family [Bacteroidota bacterium]
MMNKETYKPYISPDIKLPETTLKAILLSILLSAVLSGANAYLGLFAGMTVSASIPAAVMSMAVLKMFRKKNILENNAVQTAASAGESLAAGVIFTFPALVLMGYWESFNYFQTALVALSGGVLGVLFTIPLRNALIVKQKLKFPEGIATSEVLKSGENDPNATKYLVWGGLVGAIVKLVDSGLKIWHGIFDAAAIAFNKVYLYFGMNLSPALIGVGYIVGINIATLVFAGGVISWWIGIPIYVAINGNPEGLSAVDLGYSIWSSQIRYLGVGAMVVGGLYALINLRSSVTSAFTEGLKAFKTSKEGDKKLRTENDLPMPYVIGSILLLIIPIFFIYLNEINVISITSFMAVFMLIAGFLFSAVAAYMAGLVGSSNNPISGVTIATILTSSLILLLFLGTGSSEGPAAAIMIGTVVCCAAAIGGDNMQDLKSGHILGATPRRQQIMQMVGVIAAAFILPVILDLLNTAYGFGPKTPENPDALAAPQATLMMSVAEGVFGGGLPWNMVFIGAALALAIIIFDKYLEKRGSDFRTPVLAVAVGLYLPFELDSAIMLGGVIAWLIARNRKKQNGNETARKESDKTGLLIASGLITGEALLGILLAIPIAIVGSSSFMAVLDNPVHGIWGLLVIALVCYFIYSMTMKVFRKNT